MQTCQAEQTPNTTNFLKVYIKIEPNFGKLKKRKSWEQ